MREKRTILMRCDEARHNVRVMANMTLDRSRRPVQQIVCGCTFKTDMLCKIEFYPAAGESQCPAVQLAQKRQLK